MDVETIKKLLDVQKNSLEKGMSEDMKIFDSMTFPIVKKMSASFINDLHSIKPMTDEEINEMIKQKELEEELNRFRKWSQAMK